MTASGISARGLVLLVRGRMSEQIYGSVLEMPLLTLSVEERQAQPTEDALKIL